MSLKIKAYAKVNLWLDITGRLENGYHSLNTVMTKIDLYDNITIAESDRIVVTTDCSHIDGSVPDDEKNIAYRSAKAFYDETGIVGGAEILIEKHIPLEAGLGGSSTDGASVLLGLNELYGKPLSEEKLCEIGAKLGADVPFCIVGGTAKCRGIGDIMEQIESCEFNLVVVKPDFSCNTGKAYRIYDEKPIAEKAGFDDFCSSLKGNSRNFAGNMYNVFERLYCDERIENIKNKLLSCGAVGACMSGSGSAVFGVFDTAEAMKKAVRELEYENIFAVKSI